MPTALPSQTVMDAVVYVQATHLTQHHTGQLAVDVSCPTCLALHHAVQVALHHAAPSQVSTQAEYC
jgi:hypothetical protein